MSVLSHSIALSAQSFEELSAMAANRESTVEALLEEAVALLAAEYEDSLKAFDEGIRQIEAGEFFTNEEVRAQIDALTLKRNAA